jgi:AcrR family transcriptional regulator
MVPPFRGFFFVSLNGFRIGGLLIRRKPLNEVEMDQIPLRERNKQRVTQRIISAASELFKTCGYHSTTMDDIADKAEISRATLFNYFPTKEALLLPWGQEIMEQQILPRLNKTMKAQSTVWQVFQFLFTNMNETQREYPDVIQAFVQEAAKEYHSVPIGSERMGPQEVYTQVIRYGQNRGEIRTDLPVENLVSYLGALQMSLIFRSMEPTIAEKSSLEIGRLLTFLEKGLAH